MSFSTNLKIRVPHLYHMLMLHENIYEDWTYSLCKGALRRILMHIDLCGKFHVSAILYIQNALNAMKLI